MEVIKIMRNANGDSRTAKHIPTINEFGIANRSHREDVSNAMYFINERIRERRTKHDDTKVIEPYKSIFYRDLCDAIGGKINFEDGEWYKMHCETERHHLNKYCPEDVNLIDVIEMICDCICAGMARTGEIRPIEISTDILQKAVNNTAIMLANNVEIIEQSNE